MVGQGSAKEAIMYHYEYVSKNEAAPIKRELIEIIHAVQNIVRDDFTFQYEFIGSSSRNMITCDRTSNIGFDFDVNITVNEDVEFNSPKTIKQTLINAIDRVAKKYGYSPCEDSTSVITIKLIDHENSKIKHSCDFAIVRDIVNKNGSKMRQCIHYNKKRNKYLWVIQSHPYKLETKVETIKEQDAWNEVRVLYLEKKNNNYVPDKHSRSLYAETINEIYQRLSF